MGRLLKLRSICSDALRAGEDVPIQRFALVSLMWVDGKYSVLRQKLTAPLDSLTWAHVIRLKAFGMSPLQVRIGTSGWHYKHWLNQFYPKDLPAASMFNWYARHFDTVEINNTFYRLPNEEAVMHWRDSAPPEFVFSVKASRFVTHMKRLLDPAISTQKFFDRAELLGPKLGPILFQLPPRWKLNLQRLEEFLVTLPGGHHYVFEFRDASWAEGRVYDLLRRFNAAVCFHDWQGVRWPGELTASFAYLRFHGPTGVYCGSYPTKVLKDWSREIESWDAIKQVWIYFNNDIGGHAITNAMALRKLLNRAAPEIVPAA